jgi:hypothetical protein
MAWLASSKMAMFHGYRPTLQLSKYLPSEEYTRTQVLLWSHTKRFPSSQPNGKRQRARYEKGSQLARKSNLIEGLNVVIPNTYRQRKIVKSKGFTTNISIKHSILSKMPFAPRKIAENRKWHKRNI